MSESLFPPVEYFQPEDYSVEQECAQYAFSVIDRYSLACDEVMGDTILKTIISDRVDAIYPSEDGLQLSVRIRTAAMLGIPRTENELPGVGEQDEARIIGTAIVELGSADGEDFKVDEDFEWSAKAAIIVEFASEDEPSDVFICDPHTGKAFTQQQVLELLFLVQYIEKNLLGDEFSDMVETAAEYSKAEPITLPPIDESELDEFDDKAAEYVLDHACRECGALSCDHNS